MKTREQRPADSEGAASPTTYIVKYLVKTFIGGERFVDAVEQLDTDLQHLENPARAQA